MTEIAFGQLALWIKAIIVLIISVAIGAIIVFGVMGFAPDSFCTINAAANTLSPFHKWILFPNLFCHAKDVHIDATRTPGFNPFSSIEYCSCNEFASANNESYYPERLIDFDMDKVTGIPISSDRKADIFLYIEKESTIDGILFALNNSGSFDYTIYTKFKTYYWKGFKECAKGRLTWSSDEIVIVEIGPCLVEETELAGIRIHLENTSEQINLSAVLPCIGASAVTPFCGPVQPWNARFRMEERLGELEKDCLNASKEAGIKECTPEWQREFVIKKLDDLAIKCWKMGGRGAFAGDFECFAGQVYYNTSRGTIIDDYVKNGLDTFYYYDGEEKSYKEYYFILDKNRLNNNTLACFVVCHQNELNDTEWFSIKYCDAGLSTPSQVQIGFAHSRIEAEKGNRCPL